MARQRGAIIRRGQTYYVKYRTPSGKQKWESGFANRSQAQQRLNQLLGEIGRGSYVEPKVIKFEKFAEEWLEGRIAVPTTLVGKRASPLVYMYAGEFMPGTIASL